MPAMVCPKCNGAMSAGFVPDFSYGSIKVGTWYEGTPAKGLLGNVKLRGRPYHPITAYRCSACGFVEHYAPEQAP